MENQLFVPKSREGILVVGILVVGNLVVGMHSCVGVLVVDCSLRSRVLWTSFGGLPTSHDSASILAGRQCEVTPLYFHTTQRLLSSLGGTRSTTKRCVLFVDFVFVFRNTEQNEKPEIVVH
jgi:hypothetical protein